MINRTFIVKMPTSTSTAPVDIAVQSNPGSSTAPVTLTGAASDALYYEWRGRSLRFEQLKLTSTGAANANFVPRARLGIIANVQPYGNGAQQAEVPDLQLSASFGVFGATGIGITALVDSVTLGPIIRLVGGAGTAGKYYMVTLLLAEARDEDRNPGGI